MENNSKKNLELFTEDGFLNYASYLLSDENAVSIKVAKYSGINRTELIENNEYGFCSLIKATKNILDKIELENRTNTTITHQERKDVRLWNPLALREAIINAFVHNDYTREVPPKFEIFADRIEITSAGSLIDGLNQAEFFDGFSVPRNKELMRVYKDLKLVEQLGSGVPRILEYYSKDSFIFTDNFLRIVFQSNNLVIPHVTPHVLRLLEIFHGEMNRKEMQEKLGLSDRENFRMNYLQPALENGLVEMLYPDKPKSSKQKYRITSLGSAQLTKQPK